MLRRTVPENIIRGAVHIPSPTEHNFEFLNKGVRDQLVLSVATTMQEPLASKFLHYLGQVEPTKLDGYDTVIFNLTEYNVRVTIRMPLTTNNRHLNVTVDSIHRAPPIKLTDSWLSWMFA